MTKEQKKAYSIRELREMIGLTQEEFATLAGISSVYLSQIETGNRKLTNEAAQKITSAFEWLCTIREVGEHGEERSVGFSFSYRDVKRNHIASFYPVELQERIVELIKEEDKILEELGYILDMKELPEKKWYEGLDSMRDKRTIPYLIKNERKYIDYNVELLREEIENYRGITPAYERSDAKRLRDMIRER